MKLKDRIETKMTARGLRIKFTYQDKGFDQTKVFITKNYHTHVPFKVLPWEDYKKSIEQYSHAYSWICDCGIIRNVDFQKCQACGLRQRHLKMRYARFISKNML